MRTLFGFKDTRKNKEDFALTPYLFSVVMKGVCIKIFGIGLCWGYYSVYIGLGFNLPKNYKTFIIHDK